MTQEYPPEVQQFHDTLARIAGVLSTDTSVTGLEQLTTDDLAHVELANLPHGLLRRSGGKRGELLVQVDLTFARDEAGWLALEFIAWAVKDLARAGEQIQIRPVALPPIVREHIQLGTTLRFLIEIFVTVDRNIAPALDKLAELTTTFEHYLELYGRALGKADR